MGIILALLVFSFIVFIHELGHFLLAKKNQIAVEEFSIGMGPRLLSKEIGATRYSLKLLPLGGSCMMGEDETDDMSEGSFNSKSPWARIAVIVAGPIFNFILAFILAVILIAWIGYGKPIIGNVVDGSPAQEAGLQVGDKITKMNRRSIHLFKEVSTFNQLHQGETVRVSYERNGEQHSVTIDPELTKTGVYLLGIEGTPYTKATPVTSLKYGAYEVKYWISTALDSLKMLVSGKVGVENLTGPVGIVNIVDDSYQTSKSSGIGLVILNLINISILLSANLGVMNLLPIPALDGGRLVFLFIEVIRGKRVSPEKEGMVHLVGLMLLMGLMVFVMFNDIRTIFFR
ncbi:MAG: RIP metalloprotease RseP [Lachnospiraceae bacterium]